MSDTREHIIELADMLIRKKGYTAFSYSDIAGIMDVRNAAIHYHFPTKDALGICVIEQEIAKMVRCRRDWKDLPGDELLKKIVESFYGYSRKGLTCLNGALTSGYANFSHEMQEKVKEMCGMVLDWVAACLEKGRETRNLHFQGKSSDRALLVMSTLLASLLLARVQGEEIFERMTAQLMKDLGTSPIKWKQERIWLDELPEDENR